MLGSDWSVIVGSFCLPFIYQVFLTTIALMSDDLEQYPWAPAAVAKEKKPPRRVNQSGSWFKMLFVTVVNKRQRHRCGICLKVTKNSVFCFVWFRIENQHNLWKTTSAFVQSSKHPSSSLWCKKEDPPLVLPSCLHWDGGWLQEGRCSFSHSADLK